MKISELYKSTDSFLSFEDLETLFVAEGYTVAYITFTPTNEMYIDSQTKTTEPYTVLCVSRKIVYADNRVLGISDFIAQLAYLNRRSSAIKVDFKLVNQGKVDSASLFRTYCGSVLPKDIPNAVKTSYKRLQDFITWAATLDNPQITDIDYLADLDVLKMGLDDNEEEIDE